MVTIPPALGFRDGDHVEVEEEVKGVAFRVTKLTRMTPKELEDASHG